ncbi:MAG TPA: malonic semialdehyde reductase [Kineosporiaceae bacterium]
MSISDVDPTLDAGLGAELRVDATPGVAPLAIDDAAADVLFRAAHTANTFSDEPVADDQVRAIYELIKWAPTSMNTQPLRVTLVRTSEARERLLRHMAPGNQAKTAAAPLVAVLTADRLFHDTLPHLLAHKPGAREIFLDDDVRDAVAGFNGALQVGYFILGVRAAGLAAGPMTGYDTAGLEAEFFPAGDRRVLAVVNIGRPGPGAFRPRLPRLPYEQVVTTV